MATARLRGRGDRESTQVVGRDDAYIYMLVISLVAMIIGCVFLAMDYDSFTGKPPAPQVPVSPRQTQPAAPQ